MCFAASGGAEQREGGVSWSRSSAQLQGQNCLPNSQQLPGPSKRTLQVATTRGDLPECALGVWVLQLKPPWSFTAFLKPGLIPRVWPGEGGVARPRRRL